MNIEQSRGLSMLADCHKKGYCGMPQKPLYQVSSETELYFDTHECPWRDSYIGPQGGSNGTSKPEMWTSADSFLVKKLGVKVRYNDYNFRKNNTEKTVKRYSSELAKTKLSQTKTKLTENDLLRNVDFVDESCDLRRTTIKSLPKLKKVGANLTLDADSKLENISALKEVNGYICVVGKNKSQMEEYLKKLGICDVNGKPIPKVKKGIQFVMKSYL